MNKALINKIELIELKIYDSNLEYQAEYENLEFYKLKRSYSVIDDIDYITNKTINKTKQRIRYYEKRLNTLTDDLIRLTKRLNEYNKHIEDILK